MRTLIALVVALPALAIAQDPRQQAAASPKKWQEEQVALGTSNAAAFQKKKQEMEKTLVELDRREKA